MAIVNVIKNSYTVDSLYQWDVNQVLTIYGLSLASIPEIHFTNDAMDRAIVRQASMDSAGVITADVPNSLLQKSAKIKAYVCIYEGKTFKSLYKIEIPVKARNKPNDYKLTDDPEVYSFNALENQVLNALSAMDKMSAKADSILTDAKNLYNQALTEMNDTTANLEKEFGTFVGYSRDQILSVETKGKFGFDADAVPNDLFTFLARFNLHCWTKEAAEKQYVLRLSDSSTLITKSGGGSTPVYFYYGDSIEMDENGVLSIPDRVRGGVSYSGYENGTSDTELGGKYFTFDDAVYYYAEEGTEWIKDRDKDGDDYDYFMSINARVIYSEEVETGAVEYVFSADRNTYPDNGDVDAFHYVYLGVPLDNALNITRYKVGSYTGTGVYGSANSNSLTFDFTPKIVIVLLAGANFPSSNDGFIYLGQSGAPTSGRYIKFSVTDKTLTWYGTSASSNISSSAEYQMNTSGAVYYYIAMG